MARRIKPQEYNGTMYRSGFEKKVAQQLDKEGVEFEFERDTIVYVVPAQTRKYIPDFKLSNGVYIESKGRWTATDRNKMILVMEQNPKLDIRMLFQRDEKLNKGSKTRYSRWCEKRGIPYAIGRVPDEWLNEVRGKQE